jgi:hypothetical protein
VVAVENLGGGCAQAQREGKKMRGRCGEKQRGSPPFLGVGGSIREVARGGNGQLNGLQAIDGRGWLKRGLIRGFKAGEPRRSRRCVVVFCPRGTGSCHGPRLVDQFYGFFITKSIRNSWKILYSFTNRSLELLLAISFQS